MVARQVVPGADTTRQTVHRCRWSRVPPAAAESGFLGAKSPGPPEPFPREWTVFLEGGVTFDFSFFLCPSVIHSEALASSYSIILPALLLIHFANSIKK